MAGRLDVLAGDAEPSQQASDKSSSGKLIPNRRMTFRTGTRVDDGPITFDRLAQGLNQIKRAAGLRQHFSTTGIDNEELGLDAVP
jgi:hypothetical protein